MVSIGNSGSVFCCNFADPQGPSWLSKIRIINVTLEKLTLWQQEFEHLALQAKILPKEMWSLSINQKKVVGDLLYHQPTNSLSGVLSYLHLEKPNTHWK